MADSTISQLPVALTVSGADFIPIDQGGVTKRATLAQLGNGTVLVAPGKTLTVNNTLTFNGTDATTFTFPTTSATLARTDAAQSFTGLQTFTNGITTPAQVTSTIVTGTAPFVVASTTPVANLSIGGNAATATTTTGNAATATALQTPRTIDGVSFDGSANITVVAPATHAAPSKTTPVGADEFPIYDSVSGLLNKVTFTNGIKGTLQQSVVMVANAGTLTLTNLYNNYVDVSGTLTATGQITTTFPANTTQVTFDNTTTNFLLQINAGAYTIPSGKSVWMWDGAVFAMISEVTASTLPPTFRNRVINGDMSVSQVNGGTAITPTAPAYVTDQFYTFILQASKLTFQQVADAPAGFKNSTKITVAAQYAAGAAEAFMLRQPIEGQNIIDFQLGLATAKTIAISQYIKGSVAGTYSVFLWNGATNRSYIGTINVTNSWTQVVITLVGDTTGTWATDNTAGLYWGIDLGSGSNFNTTAGSWQAGTFVRTSGSVSFVNQVNGSTLNITGVQLEAVPTGATAGTAFEVLPYEAQLRRCQRYLPYFSTNGAVAVLMGSAYSSTTTNASLAINFPVPTRIPVTAVVVSNATYFGFTTANSLSYAASAVSFAGVLSPNNTIAQVSLTVATIPAAGYGGQIYTTNSAATMYFTGAQL
jgi:hypothetical protein